MDNNVQAMAQGLSQRVPLSQLGLAGLSPSAQNPRGGMPGGFDPMASQFDTLDRMLTDAANGLDKEGVPKSQRMAADLRDMAVKVTRMKLDHKDLIAQGTPQSAQGGTQFPPVNAMGVL